MFRRLLLIAALAGFAGYAGDPAHAAITVPSKKGEPKKPKDEPKKPKDEPKKKEPPRGPVTAPGDKGKAAPKAGTLKKYDDVITKDAKTQPGVFAVHRIDDKVYFEIPQDTLGRLLLWQAEVAKGPGGGSWGGAALGDAVAQVGAARQQDLPVEGRVRQAVRRQGRPGRRRGRQHRLDHRRFTVECEGKDRSAVINVTNMFLRDCSDLPISRAAGGGGERGRRRGRTWPTSRRSRRTSRSGRCSRSAAGGGGLGPAPAGPGRRRAAAGASPRWSTTASSCSPRADAGPVLRPARRLLHRGVRRLLRPEDVGRRARSTSPASGWRRRTRRPR